MTHKLVRIKGLEVTMVEQNFRLVGQNLNGLPFQVRNSIETFLSAKAKMKLESGRPDKVLNSHVA